jgi:hypothetical protein
MGRYMPVKGLIAAYVVLSLLYFLEVIPTAFLVWWTFSIATFSLVGGVKNEQRINKIDPVQSPENG